MGLEIKKNKEYAESNITIIGVTRSLYGRPQFFLVNSDAGENKRLKFPGARFRAPLSSGKTLEDAARDRFEEQTGLTIDKMLGLKAITPSRSRHSKQWMFTNIFLGVVSDFETRGKTDGREVYVADPGQGVSFKQEYVTSLGNSANKVPLEWVSDTYFSIAHMAKDVLNNFNWDSHSTDWYRKIPCVSAEGLASANEGSTDLGCGLAVVSMMLLYQPSEQERQKIILVHRKGDKYPGYAGGKIETLTSIDSMNVDPISCCAAEGSQEYGFPIQPRALICCSSTALDLPRGRDGEFYNSIINYSFAAQPTNPLLVEEALRNPSKFLESKMESYVVETLDEHRDRVLSGELRMPDMIKIGEQFYRESPGNKISLTQIRASGAR